ncbi:bifunctional UDP-N-acetylmuramoyl-tripeptide:D-alanyl-D-alanine ligase/alanine racemase [Lacihabitans sp. LS3-19]|uniref:bifunctional UDP-N-acetylmuramoyl-tripeptide:D-alanyl-D-alanine ligase/alanine racemase n=1 Tax=Lacihabitans sp. LS3-19 TaxID=2487335 RepID=UPI0020CCFDC3|nr:bifunctional UDP-N-acetylmuramoyl-tripeptide:D-alanyl-D-alanine ligase/alanine racemase [Lacihabitans sp. LS3-19]MCP9766810.1 bifunctional UDP-N-acetylmuramoyl-tripeptide:D-alanyl-D-alanine ligase/alanine racemase [Lacihabitans sp. LS3-19]
MLFFTENINTRAKILLTDSRFLSDPASSLFFAIKGERHNGHQFIKQLFDKGIKEFVVEKAVLDVDIDLKNFLSDSDLSAYVVQNSIKTLQNLAAEKRSHFDYPIIGITGSNGKTIVKEWLSFLLENEYNIVKSPRSYNSQIGVALSVWEMTEKSDLGIFEAGISLQNEMQNLENIIRPDIGIFTNIGPAHNEGFRSLKQKITEKLRLFKKSKVLIYCQDYKEVNEELVILLKAVNPEIKLIGWSRNNIGENWVETSAEENATNIEINYEGDSYDFEIPFTDHASIENAIHCAYTGLYLRSEKNLDLKLFFEKFKSLRPVAMRLELKQGTNDNYIIDDTYNNDFGGLKMALNFMSQHHTKRKKVLIVSDILQSGLQENDLLQNLELLIKSQNIDFLIGIGPKFFANQKLFSECSKETPFFFESTQDFLTIFNFEHLQNSLILVKGARPFAFEKIVNKLVMKVHGTVFEINLDAITHNLNFYRGKIGSNTKIMVMVKAFAYGSGSMEVASWLQYHRVDYLSVAYTDEGVVLRQNGIKLPIMVLNSDPDAYHKLFEFDLEPEIFSLKTLNEFLNFKNNNYPETEVKIHLKIDTGMNRLGFIESDLEELLNILKTEKKIKIASIFSHLVGADEAEHISFSKTQIAKFENLSNQILSKIDDKPLRHICNSAGIVRFPEAKYDMVRLGIGLYGIESAGLEQNALETVGTLKTTISQIKTLKVGDTVGYGRKGVIEKESKIATLAIGYADGYDRGFSRGIGKVSVNGILCPTVGNVCMDMTMIDVTEANCKEGDQVIVFGKNPNINELAKEIGTIPYEILTGVSERVKRVFYHE